MSDQIIFEFIVFRQEKMTPKNHLIIRFAFDRNNFPANNNELLERVRKGVTKWARETEDGQSLYAYAGDDMNFADLASHSDDEGLIRFIDGCKEFSVTSVDVSEVFTFDTSLCEDLGL